MHPIVRFLLATLAVRLIALTAHYLGTDVGGRPISASPLTVLGIAGAYHTAVLAALGVALLATGTIPGRVRPWVVRASALVLAGSMLIGQIDLGLLRHIGQNFSPSIGATYIGGSMWTSALWQPIMFDWGYTACSLGLVAAGWLALAAFLRRASPLGSLPGPSWRAIASFALLAAVVASPLPSVGGQKAFVTPPEVGLLSLVTGDATPAPGDETLAQRHVQDWLDPAGQLIWPDPHFPLVHQRRPGRGPTGPADPPDVILLMVESLRGADVGYLRSSQAGSLTPNLDRLAGRGVVFSHFVSNGFPTAPGFLSVNAGLWSHRSRIITSHFAGTSVDALPQRLAGRGYHTLWLDGGNPSFDNRLPWGQRWYEQTVWDVPGNRFLYMRRMDDEMVMRRAVELVADHDTHRRTQPLFLFLSTGGMHPPFTLETSMFAPWTAMGDASRMDTMGIDDPQVRYNIVLAAFDRALGQLVEALARRPRRDNTVIVITGDHSSATSEAADPDLRGMPTDETVWTSAIVLGPERLVGPTPRVETFPASQVDVMPSVLAMVGDEGPTAAMGRDLFDGDRTGRTAVSVRPAGFRIDRGDRSLIVGATAGAGAWVLTPFTRPAKRTGLDGSPFSTQDAQRLRGAVDYVSYLIEQNRVWPARPATPGCR